jgi:hypothetical protein
LLLESRKRCLQPALNELNGFPFCAVISSLLARFGSGTCAGCRRSVATSVLIAAHPLAVITSKGFFAHVRMDVRGRVLEIGDNAYTIRFGGSKVEKSESCTSILRNREADYVVTFRGQKCCRQKRSIA